MLRTSELPKLPFFAFLLSIRFNRILFGIIPSALMLFSSSSAYCQDDQLIKDSLQIEKYLSESGKNLNIDKRKAKANAEKALAIASKKNLPVSKAKSLRVLAKSIRNTTDINVLFGVDEKAVKAAEVTDDPVIIFKTLNDYATDLLAFNRNNEANEIIEKLESLNNQINNETLKAELLFTKALQLYAERKTKDSKRTLEESLAIAIKNNDSLAIHKIKTRLYQVALFAGGSDSLAEDVYKALYFFDRNEYVIDKAYVLFVIGDSYRLRGNMSKAFEYYNKAYPLLVKLENHSMAANIQSAFCQAFMLQNDTINLEKSIALMEKHYNKLNYVFGKALASSFWGQYYSSVGEYAKSDSCLSVSEAIAKEISSPQLKAVNSIFRVQLLTAQKKFKQADSATLKAYAGIEKTTSKELLENVKEKEAKKGIIDQSKANWERLITDSNFRKEEGLSYLQSVREKNDTTDFMVRPPFTVYDTSITATYNKQLVELEKKYQIKIMRDRVEFEHQQAFLAHQQVENRNIILIVVTLLTLFLAAGFATLYKQNNRIKQLQNEIHHRIKNNLGIINRLIDIAGKDRTDNTSLSTLKGRIKSIELVHEYLYNSKNKADYIQLQNYLEDLCKAIAETFEMGKDIKVYIDAKTEINSQVAEKLGLIINELVTNSYKYAFDNRSSGHISITARKQNKKLLELTVVDNGVGFENVNKGSYGIKLIKGLSHELNGKFLFNSNNGTKFQLIIQV